MGIDDCWVLFKRPISSQTALNEMEDVLIAKAGWHGSNKASKLKVTIVGKTEEAKN